MSIQKERIQFFQSESSFGSDSALSQSRYYDFINQIVSQSQNIFLTLQKQLLPNQNLTKQQTIRFALTRAQIIQKDTIPQHLAYLNKIQAPENAKNEVRVCSQKLKKLLLDYQKLKQGTMMYKQFYNIYGKQYGIKQDFNKKKDLNVYVQQYQPIIQKQIIQINYNNKQQKLRNSTPRVLISSTAPNNQKQLSSLKQQIHRLKKVNQDLKKKNQAQLINEHLTYQKRLRNYLQSNNSTQQLQTLKSQLRLQNQKLSSCLSLNKQLITNDQQSKKIIQTLRLDNLSLKQQIQALRKVQISIVEQQDHDKSYNSEVNEPQDKKANKKMKVLRQQNQLLKTQLKNQRQRIYKLQGQITQQQRRQLQKNKKSLQKLKKQNQQLYNNIDKLRIECLQLTHNNKSYVKLNQTLKHENNQLKKNIQKLRLNQNYSQNVLSLPVLQSSKQLSISAKTQILQYQGDGIEGIPYYQNLSKQFKIRFRRSCLKQKQLLYKLNGIQIGVISVFQSINKINILVHITNYSQFKYQKIKIKIMNANQNKINGEAFQFGKIESNQQIKLPISLIISRYPIGPLVLLMEYVSERKEELRILLPAHIFKCMNVEQRHQKLQNKDNKITLRVERKVAKDMNDIRSYFKNIKLINNILQVTLFNQHTHTLINMDLVQNQEGYDLLYQHKEGNRHITQYYIKTLCFLLSK